MAAEYVQRMGERIQERRKELDLTQLELALALPGKVGADQVSRWERGIHKPEDDTLEEIATVLKVPVAYFLAPASNGAETPDPFPATPANTEGALAEVLAAIKAQLVAQTEVLNEVKDVLLDVKGLLGKDTETAERIESATETLGGAAAQLDAQVQSILQEPSPRAGSPRKARAARKTAPKRSPRA